VTRALACLIGVVALVVPATAGAISITAPTTASAPVTLNGFDQTATFSTTLSIGAPGTAGWHITAWAPTPTSGSNTLGGVYVAAQPTTTCSGGGCVKASPSLSWPVTLGTTSSGAVKIFNAARNTGNGSADTVVVPFAIAVAANTLAGSYTTTITFAIATGP